MWKFLATYDSGELIQEYGTGMLSGIYLCCFFHSVRTGILRMEIDNKKSSKLYEFGES